MLDWLKKLTGGTSIQNKAGLGNRQVQLLAEDFAQLDELSSGISTRLTRYVVDDDGGEVLGELASLANAADKFRLRCSQHFYGLDEQGLLTLDFGQRQFIARLNEDLELTLEDAEGKALKSLPEPRKDDDEAKAAEPKKTFSAAKKELKSVLTMQRDRLYEAMCTQRTWPFEEWSQTTRT